MYYDSHCHIYKEYYDNINDVMEELVKNDIELVINNGCDRKSNEEVLMLINKYQSMYGALGIHPENLSNFSSDDINFIEEHINDNKILAIGEIGLDYHYSKDEKKEQIELFESQLRLAKKYNKPVIVHSRDATQDTIESLKKFNLKGSIHSFSGSYEVAMIYIKMGFVLGINGVITFKNSNLKDVIKKVGLENIIIETDSPYLSPHPLRGTKNHPQNVKIIVDFLAKLFELTSFEVEKITSDNLKRIFDIN